MNLLAMYVKCCVCKEFIDVKEATDGTASVSHGICPDCFVGEMEKFNKDSEDAPMVERQTLKF